MENVKKLLEYHNLPTDKLDDIIKLHFEGKQWLLDMLGLNEQNGWRVKVELPEVYEANSMIGSFLDEIAITTRFKKIDKNPGYMLDNKMEIRIGKVLVHYFKDVYFEAMKLLQRYKKEYEKKDISGIHELLKPHFSATHKMLEGAKLIIEDKDINDDEKINKLIAKFSCFYGDFAKSKRLGYISVNPIDYFLLSGTGTTFKSCIKMGGDYFNSVLHYLGNPNTIISYTVDDKFCGGEQKQLSDMPKEVSNSVHKKIGRSLFYINKGLIISSRYFGSYYGEENKAFVEFLKEKMGGEFTSNNNRDLITNTTSAYLDFEHMKAHTHKKFDKIAVVSGKCLKCGEDINSWPTEGICEPCKKGYRVCSICGKRKPNLFHSNRYGMDICEDCLKSFTYCNRCGDSVKKEHAVMLLDEHRLKRAYCDDCATKLGIKCPSCERLFVKDRVKFTDGICFTCYDELGEEA